MKNDEILTYDFQIKELSSVRISIATLKNGYEVSEKIELTDPAEEKIQNDILNNVKKIDNLPNLKGYIIELEDDPVIVEYFKLKKQAEKNKKKIKNSFWSILTRRHAKAFLPDEVPSILREYIEELEQEHEKIKKKFNVKLQQLKRNSVVYTGDVVNNFNLDAIILGEYTLAFNGIALDITDEEAQEIRKIKGVSSVSPNYEVHSLLNDVVPLIGADQVWKLDEDANDCSKSGKECLTGKDITIGILDTGVDYTHEDFGGCIQEDFLAGNCERVIGGYDYFNKDNDPMDDNGHGTHLAGIVVVVAPDANLYALKSIG